MVGCNLGRPGERRLGWRQSAAGAAALLAAALSGCASTPRVDVVSDPSLVPGRHATYRFHEPLHTDRESGEGTVLSQRLRSLAARELAARGCRRVDGDADLEVNFFTEMERRFESVPDDDWGFHYGYWNYPFGYWAGYRELRIRDYSVGTLHLDVVDVAGRQLVWEAAAADRVTSAFEYDDADIARAVARMFADFPACSGN